MPPAAPAYLHSLFSDASTPPSPTAIAAATTLAALSDSRPTTSSSTNHEDAWDDDDDDEDDYDDDDSGGISITLADLEHLEHFSATDSLADTPMNDADMAAALELPSLATVVPLHALPQGDLVPPFGIYPPHLSYHVPSVHPPLTSFGVHLSSSEHSLEPPPTLQEAHLSIQDKASFAPITSFFHYLTPGKRTVPGLDLVQVPDSITRDDLQGDRYDYQGIDWTVRNTTRSHVRAKRVDYETTKLPRSMQSVRKVIACAGTAKALAYLPQCIDAPPDVENFFQFRRNNTTHRAFFPHFQLRNVITATSRNDIYYAAGHRIFRTDADGSPSDVILDLSNRLAPDGSITTIASTKNVLIAGAFEGEYAITDLSSTYGSPCTFGGTANFATDTKSHIVNHMHLFEARRTYQPQAVLCSNDHHLRVLDCATNTFTHTFHYSAAVNSSATSPDGRMRVVVGDFQETLITNAETGESLKTLNSHTDDSFACAWADDGIHVATAAQDSTIVIWDARYWRKPLASMTSELSVPRSLHFSPIGSGPRVLIAAEADDYINVINAQTFETRQLFDFFGPIGGATFTPDGQSLFVANGERRFGGIIELERTGWEETLYATEDLREIGCYKPMPADRAESAYSICPDRDRVRSGDRPMVDWAPEFHLNSHNHVRSGHIERERRILDLGDMII